MEEYINDSTDEISAGKRVAARVDGKSSRRSDNDGNGASGGRRRSDFGGVFSGEMTMCGGGGGGFEVRVTGEPEYLHRRRTCGAGYLERELSHIFLFFFSFF